jgi:hypothetical protein
MNRELLKKALEAIKFNDEWHTKHDEHNGYFDSTIHDVNYSAIKAIEAELAKPEAHQEIDLSKLQHDDNCRYWKDEESCTCGAVYYEQLQVANERVQVANSRIVELESKLAKPAGDVTDTLYAKIMNLQCHVPQDANINQRLAFKEGHKQARHQATELICEMEAELAKPEDSGMTVLDIQDDDALRFIQRVLESDAPEADRTAARDKIVEIRTRVREFAKPEAEPVKLCFPTMLRKMWSGGEVQKWLDEQPPLYTSPRPMQRLTSEEISDLIDDHWEGDNEVHFINAIMDAMIEKNK